MSKCKRCGSRVPKGLTQCPNCGSPVERRRKWPFVALISSSLVIIACCVVCGLWLAGVFGGGQGEQPGGGGAGKGGEGVVPASEETVDPFVMLQPGFTSERVTSERTARRVIEDVADKLGIDDVDEELVDCQQDEAFDNRYWRFSQSYEGIPVYGRDVIVGADEEGEVLFLSSNFLDLEGVPTEPEISGEEAEEAAGSDAVYGGTVIYSLGDAEPCLAWQVVTYEDDGISINFVDAETGDVVGSEPLVYTESAWASGYDDQKKEDVSFDAWRDETDRYYLSDEERRIHTYDVAGEELSISAMFVGSDGFIYYFNWGDDSWSKDGKSIDRSDVPEDRVFAALSLISGQAERISSDTSEFSDSRSVGIYVRAQTAIDFYGNILGRDGHDGLGGSVYLVLNEDSEGSNNAYSNGCTPSEIKSVGIEGMNATILAFGSTIDPVVDVVTHEYTHSVERSISSMLYQGESGALMEATSDIMGEIVEDYYGDGWLNNEGWFDGSKWRNEFRSLAEPRIENCPDTYRGDYWVNTDDVSRGNDYGGVHNNSTVVSHAAYLMCNDTGLDGESLSTEEMARLVYATFFPLTPNSTFSQYRNCMELTASIMIEEGYLSSDNLTRISAAFDEVEIDRADNNDFIEDGDEGKVRDAVTKIKGSRDVALVLDCSGSMDGEPISRMRSAATDFVEVAASPNVRVGLVAYESNSAVLSPLSANLSSLGSSISRLESGGNTYMEAGLRDGMQLLGSDSGDRRRIVVLMSDGLPNEGRTGSDLVSYVNTLKEDNVKVYTLFFGDDEDGRQLLEKLASDGCYFNANNTDELEHFFNDIAEEISGTPFIRAEIDCPVEVTVTLGDETLSSDPENLNTRTSFGSLTIEPSEEGDGTTSKVLRLREGEPYDIEIVGTGEGTMDYTIGFMDEYGDYADHRTFSKIDVTEDTRMETRAERASETILRVDEDGDGVFEDVWRAASGEEAELVDNTGIVWATVAGCVLMGGGLTALGARSLSRSWKQARLAA